MVIVSEEERHVRNPFCGGPRDGPVPLPLLLKRDGPPRVGGYPRPA